MDDRNGKAFFLEQRREETTAYSRMIPLPVDPASLAQDRQGLIEKTCCDSHQAQELVPAQLPLRQYPSAVIPSYNIGAPDWDPMLQLQTYESFLNHRIFTNTTRHRAPIACCYCRRRKVRCETSMYAVYFKCQRCMEKGHECIFKPLRDQDTAFHQVQSFIPCLSRTPVASNAPFMTENSLRLSAPNFPGLGMSPQGDEIRAANHRLRPIEQSRAPKRHKPTLAENRSSVTSNASVAIDKHAIMKVGSVLQVDS